MYSGSEHKRAYIRRFWAAWLYTSVVLVFYELLLRLQVQGGILLQDVPVLFVCVYIAAGTACLACLFPGRFISLFMSVCIFVYALSYAVQICYFGVFNTFASVGALVNGTQAVTNFSFIIQGSIVENKTYLLLLFVPFLPAFGFSRCVSTPRTVRTLLYCKKVRFQRRRRVHNLPRYQKLYIVNLLQPRPYKPNRRLFRCSVFLFLCVYILFAATLLCTVQKPNSLYSVYTEKKPVEDTVRTLGVLPSFSLDIQRLIAGNNRPFSALLLKSAYSLVHVLSTGEADSPSAAIAAVSAALSLPTTSDSNVLEIDFSALMQDDADEVMHKIDAYFASRTPDKKNAYTGLFEGKNLIYITAESFSPYAVRPDVTPTLYKMVHEGFYFTHFYNPYWEVSTTDGEYVNCLSLIPKSGTFSLKDSADNYLPFALGNQFRALGYKTRAYHNYIGSYYDREITHPNLGYDFISMGNGYRETTQWPDSDLEMMQLTLGDYIDEPHFHAYYMTISGHLPYNFWANAMAIRHEKDVADLPYNEAIRAFFACNMELDLAMQYLLEQLEAKGIAQNTVIVLAADHYPYGLKFEEFKLLAGRKLDATFDLYESSLIMYNPGQKSVQVDKYCCNMDILPTISNLFALPYDSRLMMGHDIFSEAAPFLVFKSKNIITDTLKYYSASDSAVSMNGAEVTAEDIASAKKTLADQISFSSLVLDTDYFRRILPPQS